MILISPTVSQDWRAPRLFNTPDRQIIDEPAIVGESIFTLQPDPDGDRLSLVDCKGEIVYVYLAIILCNWVIYRVLLDSIDAVVFKAY